MCLFLRLRTSAPGSMAEYDTFLFTSESVNEGHPDKLADQAWPCAGTVQARTDLNVFQTSGRTRFPAPGPPVPLIMLRLTHCAPRSLMLCWMRA